MTDKIRLDVLLVDRRLFDSRERARRFIMTGNVLVNDQRVDKAGALVASDADIRLLGSDMPFVSRGGLKLQKAIESFALELDGRIAAVVNDHRVDKAGALVAADADIRLLGSDMPFVSRGGLKLQKAIESFSLEFDGRIAAVVNIQRVDKAGALVVADADIRLLDADMPFVRIEGCP